METQRKRPVKVSFNSQRDIVRKNRTSRSNIMRAYDELRRAELEVAASIQTPQKR